MLKPHFTDNGLRLKKELGVAQGHSQYFGIPELARFPSPTSSWHCRATLLPNSSFFPITSPVPIPLLGMWRLPQFREDSGRQDTTMVHQKTLLIHLQNSSPNPGSLWCQLIQRKQVINQSQPQSQTVKDLPTPSLSWKCDAKSSAAHMVVMRGKTQIRQSFMTPLLPCPAQVLQISLYQFSYTLSSRCCFSCISWCFLFVCFIFWLFFHSVIISNFPFTLKLLEWMDGHIYSYFSFLKLLFYWGITYSLKCPNLKINELLYMCTPE